MSCNLVSIWIVLAAAAFGFLAGGGRVLRWTVNGWIGKVLAVVVTYFLLGFVMNLGISRRITARFVDALTAKGNWICKLLLIVRIDVILWAVLLFFAVWLLQKALAAAVDSLLDQEGARRWINRVLGLLLTLALLFVHALLLFQIVFWFTGTDGSLYHYLQGSFMRLDRLYENNPLNGLIDSFKQSFSAARS